MTAGSASLPRVWFDFFYGQSTQYYCINVAQAVLSWPYVQCYYSVDSSSHCHIACTISWQLHDTIQIPQTLSRLAKDAGRCESKHQLLTRCSAYESKVSSISSVKYYCVLIFIVCSCFCVTRSPCLRTSTQCSICLCNPSELTQSLSCISCLLNFSASCFKSKSVCPLPQGYAHNAQERKFERQLEVSGRRCPRHLGGMQVGCWKQLAWKKEKDTFQVSWSHLTHPAN